MRAIYALDVMQTARFDYTVCLHPARFFQVATLWQCHVTKAAKNWRDWQDVYEHRGAERDNPLLADAAKFGTFLKVYSVGRTIRCGASDDLRELLRTSQFLLTDLPQDTTGAALDKEDLKLRERFGTREGQRGLRSALSKIVAFLAPHAFNAWDTYARKGLKAQTGSLSRYSLTGHLIVRRCQGDVLARRMDVPQAAFEPAA